MSKAIWAVKRAEARAPWQIRTLPKYDELNRIRHPVLLHLPGENKSRVKTAIGVCVSAPFELFCGQSISV
jgi:hypothetical protein